MKLGGGPGRGGAELYQTFDSLESWNECLMNVRVTAIAISPLLNPLPTLRLWGEETRGVGLVHAFEKAEQLWRVK